MKIPASLTRRDRVSHSSYQTVQFYKETILARVAYTELLESETIPPTVQALAAVGQIPDGAV